MDFRVLWNQILALVNNIIAWAMSLVFGAATTDREAMLKMANPCVEIAGPGGLDRLVVKDIPGDATVG
jgi:hypothetical protein